MTRTESSGANATTEYVAVLDVLRHGRQGGDRRYFDAALIAHALGESDFHLLELTLVGGTGVNIDDRLVVPPVADSELIQLVEELPYGDLSSMATTEINYVVEDIIEANEQRFVDFYNDTQPITLRLHQLSLLSGIGKELRDKILESRKRQGPSESSEDLGAHVSGLHCPKEVIVEHILDEFRDNDVKYKTFAGRDEQ